MRVVHVGAVVLIGMSIALRASHQQPTVPDFRAGVSVVELSVVVSDEGGRPISDLAASDFEILEEGQPRPLLAFRRVSRRPAGSTGAALSTNLRTEVLATNADSADSAAFVLALDDLNVSPYDSHRVIRAALGVLNAVPRNAFVAVVFTSDAAPQLLPLAPPGPEHESKIRRFRGGVLLTGAKPPPGVDYMMRSGAGRLGSTVDAPCGAVEFDKLQSQDCADPTRSSRRARAITAIGEALGRAGLRRKVIFWLTEDMGVSPLDPQGNQASQRQALQTLLAADVAVYPVNPREGQVDARTSASIEEGDRGDNRPDRRTGGRMRFGPGDGAFTGGGGQAIELNTDDMAAVTLDQIARETGGQWIRQTNDIEGVLSGVVAQNAAAYLLAFEGAAQGPSGRRSIEVRVRRDHARVYSRRVYFAGAAAVADVPQPRHAPPQLQQVLMGTAPQGTLLMSVQVVPEFAVGRVGQALVTVQVDPASADGMATDVLILSVAEDGTNSQQAFQLRPPEQGSNESWSFTTSIALARGSHQVRVAGVSADGRRTGLVITPVVVVEPGKDLLMAPPVVLERKDGQISPTLRRVFAVGTSIAMQVSVAGRPVRDKQVGVVVGLYDQNGTKVRAADVAVDPGVSADRARATAMIDTTSLEPGKYAVVLEAKGGSSAQPLRRAVPVVLLPSVSTPAKGSSAVHSGTMTDRANLYLEPLSVAHGPSTANPQRGPRVIRDKGAWEAFWRYLPTRQPAPDVDFERVTLLAFVAEEDVWPGQPTVDRIEHSGDEVVVYWRSVKSNPANADIGIPSPRPFAVVGIIGHSGAVRFRAIE